MLTTKELTPKLMKKITDWAEGEGYRYVSIEKEGNEKGWKVYIYSGEIGSGIFLDKKNKNLVDIDEALRLDKVESAKRELARLQKELGITAE